MPSGRSLADDFAEEPYGWEFDTVRLFVLALLRAGKIQMTSGGQLIESAVSLEARNVFSNNNLFRQATFQPKKGLDFPQVVEASEAFKDTFGQKRRRSSNRGPSRGRSASRSRRCEDAVQRSPHAARFERAPWRRRARRGAQPDECDPQRARRARSILTFNASHKNLKEAIKRAAELSQAVTPAQLEDIKRARRVLTERWPFLDSEPDITDAIGSTRSSSPTSSSERPSSATCPSSTSTRARSSRRSRSRRKAAIESAVRGVRRRAVDAQGNSWLGAAGRRAAGAGGECTARALAG